MAEISSLVLKTKTAEETLIWIANHPSDLELMDKMGKLTPEERIQCWLQDTIELKAEIKQEIQEFWPSLSYADLNMKVLSQLTPIQG